MTEFQDLKSEVENWNLYSDEKLASKLDSFVNRMMAQCDIISKSTEQALYESQAVSIYLSDTFNALSNLSNKQFIENSVAPVEEPQIVPKELKRSQDITTERKQENFQQALKNVIDAFNIDDDESLSNSNAVSMPSMFRADHLPFITGSKAFNQDEFIGIIDRSTNVTSTDRDTAISNESNPIIAINDQHANNTPLEVQAQPVINLPRIPEASNRIAINNTTLGLPPSLDQLFQQYEKGTVTKTTVEIYQKPVSAKPQRSLQQELNEKLENRIANQASIPVQSYETEKDEPYGRHCQAFIEGDDEDEDYEEIGNKIMFGGSNTKKENFINLLNPVAGTENPLFNTLSNTNPFDPFGFQNQFITFNPKPTQVQASVQREENKKQQERDSLVRMANANWYEGDNKLESDDDEEEKKEEEAPRMNRLTQLCEDSEEDEERRFNMQKLLSQKYRGEVQLEFEKEEAPELGQKPGANTKDDVEGSLLSQKVMQSEEPKIELIIPSKDDFLSKTEKKDKAVKGNKRVTLSYFKDSEDEMDSSGKEKKPELDDGPMIVKMTGNQETRESKRTRKLPKMFVDSDEDEDVLKKLATKIRTAQPKANPKRRLFEDSD